MAINIKNEPFNIWFGHPDSDEEDDVPQQMNNEESRVILMGANSTFSYGFTICLITPRRGYKLIFVPFPECITITHDKVHYTVMIRGLSGKEIPIEVGVTDTFEQPDVDVDKLFRQALKRRSEDAIDTIRGRQ